MCAWSGIGFVVLFLIGFGGVAGFVPPPAPGESAAGIAARYSADHTGIQIGLVISMFASALLCTWFAAIADQMKRIEGRRSVLAYAQLVAGAATVIEFLLPLMIWQAAAYRTERSADTVRALNDLGWLPFLGIISTALIQGYVFGLVILSDDRPEPVFPRWLGYFQFWIVTLLFPGATIMFFKSGPLAWNGIFAWWMVLVAYFSWIVVTTIWLVRAIKADPGPDAGPPAGSADGHSSIARLEITLTQARRELDQLHLAVDGPAPDPAELVITRAASAGAGEGS